MPELRYNLISREWVIIATERAKRPEDFVKAREKKELPEYKENCPFCPGNEAQTPGETFRIGDQKSWKLRAVFNKFGALSPEEKQTKVIEDTHRCLGGFGFHEVIIEHPRHNAFIATMADAEVENIIRAYKNRYVTLSQDSRVEGVVIFKNHGAGAGTSLEHPHSQLIATPVMPTQVRNRLEEAMQYYENTGKCLFCHTLAQEIQDKQRVVCETEGFVAFMPFAALSPFHTWIFPRRHMVSFAEISEDEMRDLALNLKTVIGKIYFGLDNPDFNYTIHTVPSYKRAKDFFHWYISIIPRVTQMAGFELGSGMFINVALPEKSAEFLRQVKIPNI